MTEDGAAAAGEFEVWALEGGAFDPRALLLVGRATGDRVETSRRLATWSGTTERGRVRVPRTAGASVLLVARQGERYGEIEVGARTRGPVELPVRARAELVARVMDGEGRPVSGVSVGLALEDPRGGLRDLPITTRTGGDGRAVLHGGTEAGAAGAPLVAVVRTATSERLARPITPSLEAAFVLPEPASVELRLVAPDGATDGARGIVQVFAASEGSRSSRATSALVEEGTSGTLVVQGGVPLRAILAVSDPADPYSLVGRTMLDIPAVRGGAMEKVTVDLTTWTELTATLRNGDGPLAAGVTVDLSNARDLRATMRVVTGDGGRVRWFVPPGRIEGGDALRVRVGRAGGEAPLPDPLPRRVDLGAIELR